jgi:hypothetical protein
MRSWDTTPGFYRTMIAKLSRKRDDVLEKLDKQRTRMVSKSSELVDIQIGNTRWSEQQDLNERVGVLLKRFRSTFKSVSELEDKVISLAEKIQVLDLQEKAFLNEREALLTTD